jgi:hypothetical protein
VCGAGFGAGDNTLGANLARRHVPYAQPQNGSLRGKMLLNSTGHRARLYNLHVAGYEYIGIRWQHACAAPRGAPSNVVIHLHELKGSILRGRVVRDDGVFVPSRSRHGSGYVRRVLRGADNLIAFIHAVGGRLSWREECNWHVVLTGFS